MDERQRTRLVGFLIALMVLAVGWNLLGKMRSEPVAATVSVATAPTPAPPPPPPRQSQAGTRIAAPPVDPSYLEQVARADIRRRIRASSSLTYLNEIVAASSDSMLHRWDNRIARPVRVSIGAGALANYQPAFLDAIRAAFRQWEGAGVPVRFDLTADSVEAEVRFVWRIQFEIDRTGQTNLEWDREGHLRSGVVSIATFDPRGQPLGPNDVRVVALHEIGHLIGLDHSPDSTDIMFAKAAVRDLSERDIRTARLLYELAPGSIR
ncbi:MAG: matrixin family metalloprotease [Gemmatimonadales bacterium]